MGRLTRALTLGAMVVLVAVPAALAAIAVTRAELNGGELRVEGQGAQAGATITVDGVAMGTAASDGRFSIRRAGFTSLTCRITVSDGVSSAQATLSGCTPAGATPPPSPPPPPPPPPPAGTASFRGLGTLPGWLQSQAWGVSGDGKVVVGQLSRLGTDTVAFRWTATQGMLELGTLGGANSEAYAASGDGSAIVGRAKNTSGNYRPFRWTPAGGMQDLPSSPPQFVSGDATDVSADGNSVVGLFGFAERWTLTGGLEELGNFSSRGISSDGQVVVGNNAHAVSWTPTGGIQDLGTVDGTESTVPGTQSFADDASGNGSVVVGQSRDRDGFWKAFRWTAATGMRDIGTLGGPMAAAYNVSDDGSVVVGRALTSGNSASDRAFRWTPQRGMQNLQQLLQNAGVTSVSGWILLGATGVSADGTVIVGEGINPAKQREAFRAVVPLP
jgi:probable HAF family extracellular repeat protein